MKFFYFKPFLKHNENVYYKIENIDNCINYNYPDKYNEIFLSSEFLSKKFLKLIKNSNKIFFEILNLIFLEQSFIFISDDIEILTTLV